MKSTAMTRRFTIRLALVAALAAASVGCSDDSKGSDTTTDGNGGTAAPGQSTAPGTTGVPPDPGTVYPLTGLPITDAAAAARPALIVKIDNDPSARPQAGLNAADIVFEQIIEVQTRFDAVFQSQGSDPVGPIRSARDQDIDLLGSFNKPLFVWSGGNHAVTNAIEASDLVDLSAQHNAVYGPGGFYRSSDRASPHNLYAQASKLWTLAPPGAGPPPQQFQYLLAGQAAVGDPAAGVDLNMGGLKIGWRYDAATGLYMRTTVGQPHGDAATGQVSTHNVIVMVVEYRRSKADSNSPEARRRERPTRATAHQSRCSASASRCFGRWRKRSAWARSAARRRSKA